MSGMKQIKATGAQGFLKWLQQYNGKLYAGVAPLLSAKMPQLFSQFETAGGLKGLACRRRSRMGRLGQTGDTGMTGLTSASTDWGNIGSTGATGSTGFSSGWGGMGSTTGTTGTTGYAGSTGSTGSTAGSTSSSSVPLGAGAAAAAGGAVDVADAANPGPLSSSDANSLAAIANDVASATQTVGQAVLTAQDIGTQLTRAQSGLTPLPIMGAGPGYVPVSSSSITSTEWLWIGAAVIGGGLLLMSGGRRRAA